MCMCNTMGSSLIEQVIVNDYLYKYHILLIYINRQIEKKNILTTYYILTLRRHTVFSVDANISSIF